MKTVIIDVRSPGEFAKNALPGAINIPSSSFSPAAFEAFRHRQICLICESGNRARYVLEQLRAEGFEGVSLFHQQMETLDLRISNTSHWSIDRQFRLVLAIFLGLFLAGTILSIKAFILIPAILFTGLAFSVITDNCYLKTGIARLPWNQKSQQ